jgi:hypothetical protein
MKGNRKGLYRIWPIWPFERRPMYRLFKLIFENPHIIIPALILFLIFHFEKEFNQEPITKEETTPKSNFIKKSFFQRKPNTKDVSINQNVESPIDRSIASTNESIENRQAKDPEILPSVETSSLGSETPSESDEHNFSTEKVGTHRSNKKKGDTQDSISPHYTTPINNGLPSSSSQTLGAPITFSNVGFNNSLPSGGSSSTSTSGNTSTTTTTHGSSTSTNSCTLSPTPSAGEYVTNPNITFSGTCTEIYYTVNEGNCLDPIEFGTTFSGVTFSVGSQNGEYCLSFYGSKNGKAISVQHATYTIDDSEPPLIFAPTIIPKRVQTNQVYKMNAYSSTTFGKSGYDFFAYNFGNINPNSLSTNCKTLAEDSGYSLINNGMRSPAGNLTETTDSLDQNDFVLIPLSFQNGLDYGMNLIISFLQYTDPLGQVKYGCLSNQVELMDFSVGQIFLNSNHQTPSNTNGANIFQGSIKSFGHFNLGSVSGSGTGQVGENIIQTDFINITN